MRTWQRWFPDAQAVITDICATYLSFGSFEDGPCATDAEFKDRLRLNQLYGYAALYWGEHAREAGGISRVALDFLRSDSLVEAHVQAIMATKRPRFFGANSLIFPRQMHGLSVAAYFGILDVVEILLQSSSNNDLKDSFDETPLFKAAREGHEAVVKMLLDTQKVDVDSKGSYGQTPLSIAATCGHEAVVKTLLEIGKAEVDSKDDEGLTPLSLAAWNGREAVVKILLEIGKADVNSKDDDGWMPLSLAAWKGHEAVVKTLLEIGKADVDSKGDDGKTPLSRAAEQGQIAVVKILLEIGKADANWEDINGRTPLI